jgi:prophage tail gpP-like protein
MSTSVEIRVAGFLLEHVQDLSLRFSMTELADSFSLTAADALPPIERAAPVEIKIQGRVVLVGEIQTVRQSSRATADDLSITGFSTAQRLVKSSVISATNPLRNLNLAQIVVIVTEPFDIVVDVAPSARQIAGEDISRIKIQDSEKAFDFLSRVCKRQGCILVSGSASVAPDRAAKASVQITRIAARESPIVIDHSNARVQAFDIERDFRGVHSTIIVNRKGGGTLDGDAGDDTDLVGREGTATDDRVPYSPLIVKAEKGGNSQADLDRQAEWEARKRAAESERVSVEVDGWSPRPAAQDPDPLFWPNTLYRVVSRRYDYDETLVLASVSLTRNMSGDSARLEFNPPDLYAVLGQPNVTSGAGRRGYRANKEWLAEHADTVTNIANASDAVDFNQVELDLIFPDPDDA